MNRSDHKNDTQGPVDREEPLAADGDVVTASNRFPLVAGSFWRQPVLPCHWPPSAAVDMRNQRRRFPLPSQPEGLVPGRTQSYASTCAGCPAGCGLLVGVRDGRPLKMEGMPEHPLSRGGLCAIGQALPLGLYDSHRLAHPLADGTRSGLGSD